MKNKKDSPHHARHEDKGGGNIGHDSTTRKTSSTNKTKTDDVNMPQGAESEYKEELLKSKRTNPKAFKKPNI